MPRFYCPTPLVPDALLELPAGAARPVQLLRLSGERAEKKVAHWHSVAVSACEQCGGNRVPTVHPVQTLAQWLKTLPVAAADSQRLLLSLRESSAALHTRPLTQEATFLSGPEGGLGSTEEDLALAHGFAPVSLGSRILRAETAALAALTTLALLP